MQTKEIIDCLKQIKNERKHDETFSHTYPISKTTEHLISDICTAFNIEEEEALELMLYLGHIVIYETYGKSEIDKMIESHK